LIRIAENQTEQTWRNLRDELQGMHLGTFTGPAGASQQRTELTPGILRSGHIPPRSRLIDHRDSSTPNEMA